MAQESYNDELGLCANGCGFFGSKTTMNLCSKCFRDKNQAEAAFQLASRPKSEAQAANSCTQFVDSASPADSSADSSTSAAAVQETQAKQQPNRCASCKKRVGLTGFKCRCEGLFCGLHRYSNEHDCPFDYRAVQRESVAKSNPVVKASKIDKI